jgi:Pallilysin beta barrel domain
MKRPAIIVSALALLASCALVISACSQSGQGRSQVIIPHVPSGTPASPSQAGSLGTLTVPVMPRPRIMIDPRDTVLQVINAQLTKGPAEEQVIAVKRMTDVNSPVRLIVVDVDPERGTYYFPSWESPTNATDNRIFSLAVKDLIGDHDVEIVASGMNRDGKLTLDVFRRIKAPSRGDLAYAPVCQIVADDIHVLESDRPDSYADDPKDGQSFPIETYVRDPDSQNVMDLLKITYQWSPQDARYVPGAPEKVPGEKAAQAQLSKLFSTLSPDSFESFLAGSWVQTQADPAAAGPMPGLTEISFDPRSRKIVLSTGDTEEVFSWRVTARTIYNSARLVGDNETVPQITRTFEITALSTVTLSVAIIGDDTPDRPQVGTYSRIADETQAMLYRHPGGKSLRQQPPLSGQYYGATGTVVDFESSRLVWKNGTRKRAAEYVLFPLAGKTILSVRFFTDARSPEEDRSWVVDFKENRNPARIKRTLVLSPVQLTVDGYEDSVGDTVTLEQEIDLKAR